MQPASHQQTVSHRRDQWWLERWCYQVLVLAHHNIAGSDTDILLIILKDFMGQLQVTTV